MPFGAHFALNFRSFTLPSQTDELLVQVEHGDHDLRREELHVLVGEALGLVDQPEHLPPVHELHHDVDPLVVVEELHHVHHEGVLDGAQDGGLSQDWFCGTLGWLFRSFSPHIR